MALTQSGISRTSDHQNNHLIRLYNHSGRDYLIRVYQASDGTKTDTSNVIVKTGTGFVVTGNNNVFENGKGSTYQSGNLQDAIANSDAETILWNYGTYFDIYVEKNF